MGNRVGVEIVGAKLGSTLGEELGCCEGVAVVGDADGEVVGVAIVG